MLLQLSRSKFVNVLINQKEAVYPCPELELNNSESLHSSKLYKLGKHGNLLISKNLDIVILVSLLNIFQNYKIYGFNNSESDLELTIYLIQ